MMNIQAFYTISELAILLNYSKSGARKFFLRSKIPIHLHGNRYVIYLSDLQDYLPDLYRSLLEAHNLLQLIDKQKDEDLEINPDLASQSQFVEKNGN